jgi:hypothetical protein
MSSAKGSLESATKQSRRPIINARWLLRRPTPIPALLPAMTKSVNKKSAANAADFKILPNL